MEGDLVYEDEILPEIEISELLDVNDSPSFIAFTDDDIQYYLQQLFPDKKQQLPLRDILQSPHQPVPDNIVLEVEATKKETDETEYLEQWDKAMQAPNYALQRLEVNKLHTPLNPDRPSHSNQPSIDETCTIKLPSGEVTKLLTNDMLTLYVSAAILNDKHKATWNPEQSKDLSEWLHTLSPSIDTIIKDGFEVLPDVYELTDKLAQFNHNFYNLTMAQFGELNTALETLKTDDEPSEAKVHKSHPQKIKDYVSFVATCEALVSKLGSYNPEKILEVLAGVEIPVLEKSDVPDPEKLFQELSTGVITIEEVQQRIKSWYASLQAKRVMTFVSDTRLFKLPEADAFKGASAYNETWKPFISLYRDIAEYLKGEDTTMYDGDPNIVPSDVYEELANELVNAEDDLDEDDAIGTLPEPAVIPTIQEEGAREVLLAMQPTIERIVKVSGIPCNVEKMMVSVSQHIIRKTRVQQIGESMEAPSDVLERMVAEGKYSPVIRKEWEFAKRDAVLMFMTEWWLDTMELVAQGTLQFDVATNAAMEYVHLWSSTGFPFDAKAAAGVLKYLAAIVEDIMPWESFTTDVMELVKTKYSDTYEAIKNRLSEVRPETNKADLAKVSLIETIKAFKANKATNILPAYIAAFMYLPSLIPQKGINRRQVAWLQGCCLVGLNDTYETDGDWKKAQAALYSMKQQLGKDRWLKPRKKLRVISPKPDTEEPKKKPQPVKGELKIDDNENEDVVIVVNNVWLQAETAALLRKDATTVTNAAKDMISKAYSSEQAKVINNLIDAELSFEQVATVLTYVITAINNNKQVKERDALLQTMKEMKAFMMQYGDMHDTSGYMHIVRYVLAMALVEGTQRNASLKPMNYSSVSKWITANTVMTPDKITEYINKKREEQKVLSLVKLDNMDDDDRVNMTEMKKLNLIKLVTRDELIRNGIPEEGDPLEEEGIREFYPLGNDQDPDDHE